jgi:alpha-mannosidase
MIPPKTREKLERRIEKLGQWRYGQIAEVEIEAVETQEHYRKPPGTRGGPSLEFKKAPVGSRWGEEWGATWFRGVIEIPASCANRRVYYRMDSFADKLLFVNGKPYAGMNPWHREVLLTPEATGKERLTIHIDQYTGHRNPHVDPSQDTSHFHQFCQSDPGQDAPLALEASELVVEREQTAALFFEADVLLRTAGIQDENSLRRAKILDGLNRAIDLIPFHWKDEEELETACRVARRRIAPLLTSTNAATTPTVGLVGHTHIDVGWLWPVAESTRKAAKTFSGMLRLMEQYPEMLFLQSQPALIDLIETEYPHIVKGIQAAVKAGRWEPNGGMWVEADCNVSSGEALVRQFLEGGKKTEHLFDYRSDTLWLPDVFGYSAALPQILKGCGIDNFVTSKINWNDTNRFPYDTFLWEGIDGTEIFTHYITCRRGGYNADVGPEISQDCWDQVQVKEVQDGVLSSIGHGDGGGGVTREMCERARRMGDLEGCAKTAFVNVSQFLKELREQNIKRPRWVGELYLEIHRGTYTSQARTKRYNRKLELLLREVELYSAMAMQSGYTYPAKELEQNWRVLLTNQFHDILPGSSIRRVYEDAEKGYAQMECDLTVLKHAALKALAATLDTSARGTPYLVSNALSWPREGQVLLECGKGRVATDADGELLPSQWFTDGERMGLVVNVPMDALSVAPIFLREDVDGAFSPFRAGDQELETPYYKVRLDKAGKIASLIDKAADREIVQKGRRLNELYTAEDVPAYWDAWDIDAFYRDTVRTEDRLKSREIVSEGALFMTIRSTYAIGRQSTLVQDTTFYADSPRIDFRTKVDWQERHTLLKVGFPVDVHTDTMRNEIQYGHVLRNRHANTSFDQAQFEVCAHKWVDVSEGNYGVAILNDCKYGHDSLDDMISITLLKSPEAPDPIADKGTHEFTYALLPHMGDFSAEEVVREAYDLNVPLDVLRVPKTQGGDAQVTLCSVDNPNVIIEAVKRAEDGDAIVVRVYEAGKTRGAATLTFSRLIEEAVECNLLERDDVPTRTRRNELTFPIAPFEIKTFKIRFAQG